MNDLLQDRLNSLESELCGARDKTEKTRAIITAVNNYYLYCFKETLTKADETMILHTFKTWRVLMLCLLDTLDEAGNDLQKSFDCIQRIYDTL